MFALHELGSQDRATCEQSLSKKCFLLGTWVRAAFSQAMVFSHPAFESSLDLLHQLGLEVLELSFLKQRVRKRGEHFAELLGGLAAISCAPPALPQVDLAPNPRSVSQNKWGFAR